MLTISGGWQVLQCIYLCIYLFTYAQTVALCVISVMISVMLTAGNNDISNPLLVQILPS